MTELVLLELARTAITTMLIVLFPLLAAILVVGLLVSIVQAVTQVNEQTLVFVPKIVVAFLVLLFAGSWMARQLAAFTVDVLTLLPLLRR